MAAILVSEVVMPADEKTPAVNLKLPADLLAQIDEHRFEHRWKSRVAAMKYLLNWALEQHPEPSLADHERWS